MFVGVWFFFAYHIIPLFRFAVVPNSYRQVKHVKWEPTCLLTCIHPEGTGLIPFSNLAIGIEGL